MHRSKNNKGKKNSGIPAYKHFRINEKVYKNET